MKTNGGLMHVKTSGTWLRQAEEKNIFAEVDAQDIRRTPDSVRELLEWDAEKYRQKLIQENKT